MGRFCTLNKWNSILLISKGRSNSYHNLGGSQLQEACHLTVAEAASPTPESAALSLLWRPLSLAPSASCLHSLMLLRLLLHFQPLPWTMVFAVFMLQTLPLILT